MQVHPPAVVDLDLAVVAVQFHHLSVRRHRMGLHRAAAPVRVVFARLARRHNPGIRHLEVHARVVQVARVAVPVVRPNRFTEKNQVILAYSVEAAGELKTGAEISEVRLFSRKALTRWQFGRLALTAEVVNRWLEQ